MRHFVAYHNAEKMGFEYEPIGEYAFSAERLSHSWNEWLVRWFQDDFCTACGEVFRTMSVQFAVNRLALMIRISAVYAVIIIGKL